MKFKIRLIGIGAEFWKIVKCLPLWWYLAAASPVKLLLDGTWYEGEEYAESIADSAEFELSLNSNSLPDILNFCYWHYCTNFLLKLLTRLSTPHQILFLFGQIATHKQSIHFYSVQFTGLMWVFLCLNGAHRTKAAGPAGLQFQLGLANDGQGLACEFLPNLSALPISNIRATRTRC